LYENGKRRFVNVRKGVKLFLYLLTYLEKNQNLVEEQCDCLLFFEINPKTTSNSNSICQKEYIKLIFA
jgi:hypothetical protein